MARTFGDNTVPTYDSTNFKFTDNPLSSYILYNYTDTNNFQGKVDNSMASVMRDCAECHVGGGGNEYIPNKRPDLRVALRNYTTTTVNTYSYYINQYGSNGDGKFANFSAVKSDYRTTGVLEMDCLICHLKDYNYEGRKHAVRKGEFDASRTAGAGIGTAVTGTTVTYDTTKVVDNGLGKLKLAGTVVANILPTPDTNNCVNCHMKEHAVDWKKRGDQWTTDEIHYSIGCMGCHKRQDSDFSKVGTSGFAGLKGTYGFGNISSAANAGYDANRLGQCDPSKGHAPYGSLWNKNDHVSSQAKAVDFACKGCHIDGGYWDGATFRAMDTKNAPNPTGTHDAAFLTAKIMQDSSYSGTATKSHLDVITCTSCHTGKGNYSGGAMVDGTGADSEGRLADHENKYVERNMVGKVVYEWQGGTLIPSNLSTSIFWRDKNDVNFDGNGDGRAGGMDGLLQTHVADINRNNSLVALTLGSRIGTEPDGVTPIYDGLVTPSLLDSHITAINGSLESKLKVAPATKAIKLSFMGVGFKSNHGIVSASQARGSGARGGCADCHGPNKGYYNGQFRVTGDNLSFNYRGNQITPFAMVNGSTQPTDFHVGMKDRSEVRSLAVQFASYSSASANTFSVHDIDRSQTMYESSFMKRNGTWKTSLPATGITSAKWPNGTTTTTQGWLLKIEVHDDAEPDATKILKTYTRQVTAYYANADLMVNDVDGKGLALIKATPHFTIAPDVAGGYNIVITAMPGYKIRLHPQSDAGSFGLGGELWTAQTYTGVVKDDLGGTQTATGRVTWVNYLNSLGDANTKTKLGLGTMPNAVISDTTPAEADPSVAGLQLTKQSYTFNPNTTGNSTYVTYKWSFSDGVILTSTLASGAVTRDFTSVPSGNYNVTLTVTGVDGKSSSTTQSITVADAYNTGISVAPTSATKGVSTSFVFSGLTTTHNSVRIFWGDLKSDSITDSTTSVTKAHTYTFSGSKKVNVILYNNGVQVAQKYLYITVP